MFHDPVPQYYEENKVKTCHVCRFHIKIIRLCFARLIIYRSRSPQGGQTVLSTQFDHVVDCQLGPEFGEKTS